MLNETLEAARAYQRDKADAYERGYKQGKADAESHEIGYNECANALLKMWMDNVLTDGEYYRIADKLNEKWGKTELPEPYKGVTS